MGAGERLLTQLRSEGCGYNTVGTGSCSEQVPDFCKKSQEKVSLVPQAPCPLQIVIPCTSADAHT